ncbi:hypothetical protein [Microvirga makkahensis]|uniref:Uncharacterized protein n=1 Tax=Microvirga makkahensis TaxID=1128670 RepID=A0A7X3MX20_9HYPH|nr:hypothetical protein [Microvirga makkahensis]MXQ14791.1 hypothetical protein [Microvirga makkahensis]
MTEKRDTKHDPVASGSPSAHRPDHQGGDAVQNAQKWGGGGSGSKGSAKPSGNQNQNSGEKT